jgi:predicted dehydrogenase/threonine dehydrogenase-like Zn-dependent dehydrogenase
MQQVLQDLKTGNVELIKAPAPQIRHRHVLIETRKSLISAGTERMLLEFGRGNLLQKALQQPDKVQQALHKAKTDGIAPTVKAIRTKLGQLLPLGYCNAGIVHQLGSDVPHLKVGDRVVSNGPHAELVVIGRNLVAKIPDSVSDEEAAFAPLAAIALQGCRLAAPTFGETFCVIGLGLVGLITGQLLRASGCRVLGVDLSEERLALARQWSIETINVAAGQEPVSAALSATHGVGVDGVIIAASTTSNDPMRQAAQMSRKRGRIILTGVTGLTLSRDAFYEKELRFQVSCSYGPGRYDDTYEELGEDYPHGFVRWTAQRNFDAVLQAMANRQLDVKPLISARADVTQAHEIYAQLAKNDAADLGLILSYPEKAPSKFNKHVLLSAPAASRASGNATIAMVGAGSFGKQVTVPALKKAGTRLKTLISAGGVSSVIEGQKAGFEEATTDFDRALVDPEIDSVVIATRHDTHADFVMRSLKTGKHVFVEKPLALIEAQLDEITSVLQSEGPAPCLLVGFNRRFSPYAIRMKELLDTVKEPKCLVAHVNAGQLPEGHWMHETQQGGRIIGEACHFIDLLRFLTGAPITDVHTTCIGKPTSDGVQDDKATITLSFADGSIGTIHYFANGPRALEKERIETYAAGKFLRLNNFKKLEAIGWGKGAAMSGRQDKGHKAILNAFIEAVRHGRPSPIPPDELLEVSRWAIRAAACDG